MNNSDNYDTWSYFHFVLLWTADDTLCLMLRLCVGSTTVALLSSNLCYLCSFIELIILAVERVVFGRLLSGAWPQSATGTYLFVIAKLVSSGYWYKLSPLHNRAVSLLALNNYPVCSICVTWGYLSMCFCCKWDTAPAARW